ncbi:monovalent cation/H+ antiporter complex subunit F [Haliea sp. E1-2-M8]|uniref:monovalent cation/H+ antiporter complex subunit F n=1 Tax=Haliea sp. E1-2-M8 TaxID=3064706 RepID=UPI0027243B52|nr:monovalent cation/H+ antiporter complex subunit F [Haliea sp. E1-2-M8]MDO8863101.1 monovalent cation/H+ antiporter complex subunit F [Haliea sp. E1-2-M8]
MILLLDAVAAVLLFLLLLGLLRIWRGPAPADRMLASQLFGTTGVALLLVLAESQAEPALRDVALVLALLAVLSTVAFVTRVLRIANADSAGEQHDA